jgi:hypothetical protein
MFNRIYELLLNEAKDLVDYISSSPRTMSGASRAYKGIVRDYYNEANKKYKDTDDFKVTHKIRQMFKTIGAVPRKRERDVYRLKGKYQELKNKRHKRRYNPPD